MNRTLDFDTCGQTCVASSSRLPNPVSLILRNVITRLKFTVHTCGELCRYSKFWRSGCFCSFMFDAILCNSVLQQSNGNFSLESDTVPMQLRLQPELLYPFRSEVKVWPNCQIECCMSASTPILGEKHANKWTLSCSLNHDLYLEPVFIKCYDFVGPCQVRKGLWELCYIHKVILQLKYCPGLIISS